MKKTFKFIVVFIFLFMIGIKVNAESMYEEVWRNKYGNYDDYIYLNDVITLNDGFINLGGVDRYISEDEFYYGSYVARYDFSGKELWKFEKEYYYYLKGVEVSDGIVVLADYYSEDTEKQNTSLIKFDFNGNLIWEEKFEDLYIEWFELLSLDSYNDKIVFTLNNYVYVYNTSGKMLKVLSDDELLMPAVTINSDAIYLAGVDDNANLVLEKYDLSTYKKLDSAIVYEGTLEDGALVDSAIPSAITTVKSNIVISTLSTSDISELFVYNNKLENLNRKEINTISEEIVEDNKSFFVFGRKYDRNPQGLNKDILDYLNGKKGSSSKKPNLAKGTDFYNIDRYSMNLELESNDSFESFIIRGLDVTNDGFMFVGDDGNSFSSGYRYQEKLLYLTFDKEGHFSSLDEWFEKIVYVDDGFIMTGEYDDVNPVGIDDAKDADYSYIGYISKFDKEGKLVWSLENNNIIYLGLKDVQSGVIALACSYHYKNDVPYLYLVKYDYDGNEVWKKTILEDYILHRWDFDKTSFEIYDDYIVVMIYDGVYLYDINGEFINKLEDDRIDDNYKININKDGIYLAYKDENYAGHISKFNFKLELEKEFIYSEHIDEVLSISFVDNDILVSFDDRLLFMDTSLNEIRRIETKFELSKIKKMGNYFVAFGHNYCQPKGSESCDASYIIVYDSNFNVYAYRYIEFDIYDLDVDLKDNDIYIVGYFYNQDDRVYEGMIEKYHLSSYSVGVATDGNGTITSNKVLSASGEEIEFSVEPKDGYVLKRVVVTTASGEVVEFNDYKFTMPSENVEIYAEFELLPSNPNTGLSNPLVIFSGILAIALVGSLVVKKKKFI